MPTGAVPDCVAVSITFAVKVDMIASNSVDLMNKLRIYSKANYEDKYELYDATSIKVTVADGTYVLKTKVRHFTWFTVALQSPENMLQRYLRFTYSSLPQTFLTGTNITEPSNEVSLQPTELKVGNLTSKSMRLAFKDAVLTTKTREQQLGVSLGADPASVTASVSRNKTATPIDACTEQLSGDDIPAFDSTQQFLHTATLSDGTTAQMLIIYTVDRDITDPTYNIITIFYQTRLLPGQLLVLYPSFLQKPPLWIGRLAVNNMLYMPNLVFTIVREMPDLQGLLDTEMLVVGPATTAGITTSNNQSWVYLGICMALLVAMVWPVVLTYWRYDCM
jgi:hypothetical protein